MGTLWPVLGTAVLNKWVKLWLAAGGHGAGCSSSGSVPFLGAPPNGPAESWTQISGLGWEYRQEVLAHQELELGVPGSWGRPEAGVLEQGLTPDFISPSV